MPFVSFLTWPMFFAGLAAASVPIIIHILNRRRYQRVSWAAMEYLLQAEKITRKRIQVEHILLLIIRTLVVLLLFWALAGPFLSCSGLLPAALIGEGGRNVIVLMDDSYSMELKNNREETAFERAQLRLDELFNGLTPGDRLTLIRSSDAYRWARERGTDQGLNARGAKADPTPPTETAKPVSRRSDSVEPYLYLSHERIGSDNIESLKGKLAQLTASDAHTDFYHVFKLLQADVDRLEDAEQFNREIFVISDFREFGWIRRDRPDEPLDPAKADQEKKAFTALLKELTDNEEPQRRAAVTLVDVGEQAGPNVSIESVAIDGIHLPVTQSRIGMKVHLLNRSDAKATNVAISRLVNGRVAETIKEDLEPGKEKSVLFEFELEEPGPYSIEFRVEDSLEPDSHYFYPLNLREGVKVLMVSGENGTEPDESETILLRNALFPRKSADVGAFRKRDVILEPEVVTDLADATRLEDYDLVIIANADIGAGYRDRVKELTRYVAEGGALFFFLGSKVRPNDFNLMFFDNEGLSPVKLGEPAGELLDDRIFWELAPTAANHPTLKPLEEAGLFESDAYTPHVLRRFPLTRQTEREGEIVTTLFSYRKPGGPIEMPAVVMKEYTGGGMTAVFSFTADGEWTDFLTNKYKVVMALPFLHLLVGHAVNRHAEIDPRNVPVGTPITMALDARRSLGRAQLKVPTDSEKAQYSEAGEYVSDRASTEGGKAFRFVYGDTFKAGRYLVSDKGTGKMPEIFATNVFLAESDLTRTSMEELRRAFPGFAFSERVELEGDTEAVSEAWKLLVFLVLGLLIAESILAAVVSSSGGPRR